MRETEKQEIQRSEGEEGVRERERDERQRERETTDTEDRDKQRSKIVSGVRQREE